MIRELAHHCRSTALAFSLHTHPIAVQAYVWRGGNKVPYHSKTLSPGVFSSFSSVVTSVSP